VFAEERKMVVVEVRVEAVQVGRMKRARRTTMTIWRRWTPCSRGGRVQRRVGSKKLSMSGMSNALFSSPFMN
jgi:hypothetical protein